MDTRYQVFISSTFTDLKDERQAVLKAILELDHMPAGMELFPASDDTAWQLIKDVIDASDYYVVIIGGRYGSQDEAGIGFTEKEYDYAIQTKKPVISLLYENPDNLPRDKTETEEAIWEKLKGFRAKVEKDHTCSYWNSTDELKARVIIGLTATMKRHPASGWVRVDDVPTEATLSEMLALRKRIAELEAEVAADRVRPPEGTQDLEQGEDTVELEFTFLGHLNKGKSTQAEFEGSVFLSWDVIFAGIAPSMINEISHSELAKMFLWVVNSKALEVFREDEDIIPDSISGVTLHNRHDCLETCIVQFRALGLIRESTRQRSLRDTGTYWCLTPYGDYLMSQLRAIRREPNSPAKAESEVKPNEEPSATRDPTKVQPAPCLPP